ncbi:MAG: hypothetical protein IKL10_05945 [Clostridia bacterium]|nr:hypothetical protein [Clostridia bacterium]
MKISEIEEKMIDGEFSEEIFEQFVKALSRVPKTLRMQHCYTTAYSMREKDPENALRLINYALETFEGTALDIKRSLYNLGGIYEFTGDYKNANISYKKSLDAVPENTRESHTPSIAMDILRTELHCCNFCYSDYINELYNALLKADEFTASFRRFIFYRSVTEIIIAKKNEDTKLHKTAFDNAMKALDGSKKTGMDMLLLRHKFEDEAGATKEALEFLRNNGI